MDWASVLDTGVGVGVLLIGAGVFAAMFALARVFTRLRTTLDEVDRQIAGLGKPVGEALEHVEGIAGTADETLARLGGAVASLESVAKSVSGTTTLVREALSPAIVNVGATLSGLSAGLRRLVTGKNAKDTSEELIHHGK
jgi:ABC-type transporter Mla subunit MlaD